MRTVHVRCAYWGDFVDLSTYSTVKCVCFQGVKGITMHMLHPVPPYNFTHVSFMASRGHHCHLHSIKW